MAADPHLNDISSHYPVFRANNDAASENTKELKKAANLTFLICLTFMLMIPLAWFGVVLLNDSSFNIYMLVILVPCIVLHAIVIGRRADLKSFLRVFFKVFSFNILLLTVYFLVSILLVEGYGTSGEFLIWLVAYILILISVIIVCQHRLSGALLWGAMLAFFFLWSIGIARSAETALRYLNLGGNVPAQFFVKTEACGPLEHFGIMEGHPVAGPDGKVASCTTEPVCVVLNVGDTVHVRRDYGKDCKDIAAQDAKPDVLGIDRKYIIGMVSSSETKSEGNNEK